MVAPKMVDVGNERIRASKIKRYSCYNGSLFIRNNNELRVVPDTGADQLGFIERLKYKRLNRLTEKSTNKYTKFWEEVSFPYIRIIMFDGTVYNVCSDQETKELYYRTKKFINSKRDWNYDRYESDMVKAEKSLSEYANLNFVDYDILNNLDDIFKTVK